MMEIPKTGFMARIYLANESVCLRHHSRLKFWKRGRNRCAEWDYSKISKTIKVAGGSSLLDLAMKEREN